MADETLSPAEWKAIADFIRAEKDRRKSKRQDLENMWAEVDRQIAMEAKPREVIDGQDKDWFPNVELPLQFDALEVIAADTRRLKFPRGPEWYEVSACISPEYERRFRVQLSKKPLVGDQVAPIESEQDLTDFVLSQETGDLLIKSTMDHFHRSYDFRGAIDLFDAEKIKYGTGVARVREVTLPKFSHDFRGTRSDLTRGPAVIPCSIKTTYLDDTPSAMMHEGIRISPSPIREFSQRFTDLMMAAKKGGPERGWILPHVAKLRRSMTKERLTEQVELLEFEGDLVAPKSQGSIFLPNVIVTVAVARNALQPVRFRKNPVPHRSYVPGWYMRESLDSPYGVSPLMKGQPIQEAATLVFNAAMAASALNAEPPVAYDSNDAELRASGGPEIYPGAKWPTDSPNAVEPQEIGRVTDLWNAYTLLVDQYENLTGVNDPRRGAPGRSHTTAGAAELENLRGLARTDDFVVADEQGAMTTILNMEYDIIKRSMTRPVQVFVSGEGVEGWVNVTKDDLADQAQFLVRGSAGVLDERDRNLAFRDATNFAIEMVAAAANRAQLTGEPIPALKWEAIIAEGYQNAGVQNASRFIAGSTQLPEPEETGAAVEGADQGPAAEGAAPLQAA